MGKPSPVGVVFMPAVVRVMVKLAGSKQALLAVIDSKIRK